MCQTLVLTACYVILVTSAVIGAPVGDKKPEGQKQGSSPTSEIRDQEKDLEDLLNLVHKESHQNGVVVHKEEVSHFENNNGQEVKVQAKEEKVVDKSTGNLIADVKQEVKQESAGHGTKPETVVATKVDIPAEGVHETFIQEGQGNEKDVRDNSDNGEAELTPTDMAEYLYSTQQFAAFYSALERLVNQSKMSAEDAETYARAVALEYERLQLEDFEQRFVAEKRFYPQMLQENDGQDTVPDFYPHSNTEFGGDDRYQLADFYGYPAGYLNQEDQLNSQQDAQGYFGDIDPYEFLAGLWNEAYGKGNEEAQEIVKMLYDRVSQDDNPDDMGQIRDLLAETITASMNEEPFNSQPEEVQADRPAATQAKEEAEQKSKAETKTAEKVREQKQVPAKTEQKEEKANTKTENKADKQKQ